jgi:hypothetical protein
MAQEMRSEALIIAQPSYKDKDWDPLPRAAEAARELAESLAKHGYALANLQLLGGGDKQHAEAAIDDWFAGVPEDARLILFWTGHGSSDGGLHYLICRTSPRSKLSSFTAIEAGALGAVIANCKADKKPSPTLMLLLGRPSVSKASVAAFEISLLAAGSAAELRRRPGASDTGSARRSLG